MATPSTLPQIGTYGSSLGVSMSDQYDKNQTDLLLDFTDKIYREIKEIRHELHMAIESIRENINDRLNQVCQEQRETINKLSHITEEQARQGRLVDRMWVLRYAIILGFVLILVTLLNPEIAEKIVPVLVKFVGVL